MHSPVLKTRCAYVMSVCVTKCDVHIVIFRSTRRACQLPRVGKDKPTVTVTSLTHVNYLSNIADPTFSHIVSWTTINILNTAD